MYSKDMDLNKEGVGKGMDMDTKKAGPSVDMGADLNGGRIARGPMTRADNGSGGTPNPNPGARSQGTAIVKPGEMRTQEGQ